MQWTHGCCAGSPRSTEPSFCHRQSCICLAGHEVAALIKITRRENILRAKQMKQKSESTRSKGEAIFGWVCHDGFMTKQ